MDWPEPTSIVWLPRDHFRRIYGARRDHLAGMGVDVGGLDAADGGDEVGVFVASVGGRRSAFFITHQQVLGSVRVRD